MPDNALRVGDKDNVAVALVPLAKNAPVILKGKQVCRAVEDIKPGHKVALEGIPRGGKVVRYGETIVVATRRIKCGEWVHVHNTRPEPVG
jgi:hypothetical protein